MSVTLSFPAANGAQVAAISGGAVGYHSAVLSFATYPSAGTATIEYRLIGSTAWQSIVSNVSVTAEVNLEFEGAINAIRVTFAGLVGGTSPQMWISTQQTATPPFDLMTDGGTGPNRRLRVDPGQTGFFAGKFFRNYFEALIPTAGPAVQLRFTSPIDFILWSQVLELTQGAVELRVYSGGTSTGTWTDVTPIGVNRMAQRPQPYYVAQCRLATGGNFTGGTEVDVMKVRTSAQNATASNIQYSSSERGLPSGEYFIRIQTLTGGLQVNDAAQLIYSIVWEERP